jgi:dTDP-4-dehydrorhamnose reductase
MKLSKSTKIFITGCGGMLGDAVYKTLNLSSKVLATDIDVNADFLTKADVRNFHEMDKLISEYNPDIVFHLAALTDLEYCELNPEEAWDTNALGTDNIASICKKLDVPMVYICTAGIFDGNQEEYHDYDTPNPINVYGKSKYAGELTIKELLSKYYIFRAGWMMGGGPKKDKKFVNKIMRQLESGAKELHVVDDKLGTPTYTFDFARNMVKVIEQEAYGIYNSVCSGSCSRYEVAEEILKLTRKNDVTLNKVTSDYFKDEYFAKRPYSEKLLPLKLIKRDLYIMRDWKICLREYMEDWKNY